MTKDIIGNSILVFVLLLSMVLAYFVYGDYKQIQVTNNKADGIITFLNQAIAEAQKQKEAPQSVK